jgi:tripartite-type tricarboxylate transporter receptor subunit TctC
MTLWTPRAVAAMLSLWLMAGAAAAQSWPERQIFLIVPFAAGGGTDAFARPLAAQLDKQLNQRVLIENRAGAGGTAGAAAAAKAAPDGYTFFVGATHHAIAPSIYPKLTYDIENDFVPIAMIARPPHVIVVHPGKVAAKSVKDLVDQAKAAPGAMTYASAGNGTTHHLAGELFKALTKTDIAHVAYRGAGPALQDLIAGHVQIAFDGLGSSAGAIAAGQLRALAVAAPARVPSLPDVPTAAEAGLPGYEVATWYALWAPKGTPASIVERMTKEVTTALAEPAIRSAWERQGTDVPAMTGPAFGAFVAQEIKRWADVVKQAGVSLEP